MAVNKGEGGLNLVSVQNQKLMRPAEREIYRVKRKLDKERRAKGNGNYPNAGKPWNLFEIIVILTLRWPMEDRVLNFRELAEKIGRSPGSIQNERSVLFGNPRRAKNKYGVIIPPLSSRARGTGVIALQKSLSEFPFSKNTA